MSGIRPVEVGVEEVSVAEKRLEDYRPVIERSAYNELLDLGRRLKGKRIAHINATAYGGGVADLLQSIVPLMADLGLDVHWFAFTDRRPSFLSKSSASPSKRRRVVAYHRRCRTPSSPPCGRARQSGPSR